MGSDPILSSGVDSSHSGTPTPESGLMREPGVMMPARFNGSAADTRGAAPDILIAPHLAQQLDRLGPRELLADEARHEPPAANFSLRFHAAERDEQVAPRRRDGLARDEIAEHDAPPQQQLPRHRLERLCGQSVGDV